MKLSKLNQILVAGWVILNAPSIYASIVVPMYLVDAQGQRQSIGTVTIDKSTCGILLTPQLHDLPPGVHGFHIHDYPSCQDHGMAAGGHLDPAKTKAHNGPYEAHSHLGDLPVLVVEASGEATLPVLAPRLSLAEVKRHALMIHEGGDNYSDTPEKLGGGGARIACGIIK